MESLLRFIEDYGFGSVVMVILLYLLYTAISDRIAIKRMKNEAEIKREETSTDEQKSEAEVERFKKLIEIMQDSFSPKHTFEEQEKDRRIHEIIQTYLDCLVSKGAHRAYYFTFHNGGKDILGRGLLKMSIIVESVDHGKRIMQDYQNVMRSMLPVLYNALDERGYYYVPDVENILTTDQTTYYFITEHDAKSAMFKAIKRSDGLIVGFVGIEFDHVIDNVDTVKPLLDQKTDRIAGALLYSQENA